MDRNYKLWLLAGVGVAFGLVAVGCQHDVKGIDPGKPMSPLDGSHIKVLGGSITLRTPAATGWSTLQGCSGCFQTTLGDASQINLDDTDAATNSIPQTQAWSLEIYVRQADGTAKLPNSADAAILICTKYNDNGGCLLTGQGQSDGNLTVIPLNGAILVRNVIEAHDYGNALHYYNSACPAPTSATPPLPLVPAVPAMFPLCEHPGYMVLTINNGKDNVSTNFLCKNGECRLSIGK